MRNFFLAVLLAAMLPMLGATRNIDLSLLVDPPTAEPPAPAQPAAPPAGQPSAPPAGANDGRLGALMQEENARDLENTTGWFIGPMIWKLSLDMSAFAPMTTDRGLSSFQESPFVIGLMGGIIRDNWRYGALVVGGSQSTYKKFTEIPPAPREPYEYYRGARMNFMSVGLFLDYDREYKSYLDKKYYSRVPYLRYGWLVGGILGAGWLDLEASGIDLGDSDKWTASQLIYVVNPYVGVWVSPFDWLWTQFEVGYAAVVMSADDAAYENDNGTPMVDGAIAGGPQFGFKIVFGSNPNFKVKVSPPR